MNIKITLLAITVFAISVLLSLPAHAKNTTWLCHSPGDPTKKTLLTAIVIPNTIRHALPYRGLIDASGIIITARYSVEGIVQRWDFNKASFDEPPKPGYPYSFVIKPNGNGYYYDFTVNEENTYEIFFKCEPKQSKQT